MQKYVFRKYDPEYRAFFTSEKKKIAKALGSTAIPHLGGKGILDIAVGSLRSAPRCALSLFAPSGRFTAYI